MTETSIDCLTKRAIDIAKTAANRKGKLLYFQELLREAQAANLDFCSESIRSLMLQTKRDPLQALQHARQAYALNATSPLVLLALGNSHRDIGSFDEAIEAFSKMVGVTEYAAVAHYGIASVYARNKDFVTAMEHCDAAIALDDNFAAPWNGKGACKAGLGDIPNALACYEEALRIDPNYIWALNNMGIVYFDCGSIEKGVEAFEKALIVDKDPDIYKNFAQQYLKAALPALALPLLSEALLLYEEEKSDFLISITRNLIGECKKQLDTAAELDRQKPTNDPAVVVLRMIQEQGIAKTAFDNQKSFIEFIKEKETGAGDESYFKVLRRWNSYTPIIADNFHISKGGGYFLKINGKGIVIDPGFNFIDNFKGAGHFFEEIDAVFISHAHDDHTADLESILTLLNRRNEVVKGLKDKSLDDSFLSEYAQARNLSINDVKPAEVEAAFARSKRRKTVDLFLTKSTLKKYSGLFDLFSSNDYKIHIVEKGEYRKVFGTPFKVLFAKHHDIISDRDSVGFVFEVGDTALIYTGDTGWSEDTEKIYKSVAKKYRSFYKVLVAHLGGFKDYEDDYLLNTKGFEAFYKNHLGRLGLARINNVLKPNVCFISEFGEELRDHRSEIADIFSVVFKDEIVFLPADIGLTVDLRKRMIDAITGFGKDGTLVKELVDPIDVRSQLLLKDCSLHYYSSSSKIRTDRLVQVIADGFDRSRR